MKKSLVSSSRAIPKVENTGFGKKNGTFENKKTNIQKKN